MSSVGLAMRVGAGALAGIAGPSLTAVPALRRRLVPRLAGITTGQHIALTYDDGPDPASTPAFLDLLASYHVRCTFFLLAEQALRAPAVVRRTADEGHELAIHGWTHRCTLAIAPTRLARQLRDAKHCVEDIIGSAVTWYRPPYGVLSTEALWACRSLALTPVLWTAWGRDWERSATSARIVSTVLSTLQPGGTILLHDTDLHARGDWRDTLHATATLLSGPLRPQAVGPLREHGPLADRS